MVAYQKDECNVSNRYKNK